MVSFKVSFILTDKLAFVNICLEIEYVGCLEAGCEGCVKG